MHVRCVPSYRLAPEHPYPAPLDDCVKATRYFMSNAKRFGVDKYRIAVAGDSNGGNLAAALTLRTRDETWSPALKAQVLFYPPLQAMDFNTSSYERYRCNGVVDQPGMTTAWLWYAFGDITRFRLNDFAYNSHVSDSAKEFYSSYVNVPLSVTSQGPTPCPRSNDTLWEELKDVFIDPYFAPLMAKNLGALPSTFISTAEHDVLRDDGITYAARLREAGVNVDHRHYLASHGLIPFPFLETARKQATDAVEYLLINL
ncbi:Neutral cholesterol ester hydrolase 1 [Lamellibrachia satsuma]|nr:Neutral cholesterol ester hydrolase 1 [Lamellibrachia satsuma]